MKKTRAVAACLLLGLAATATAAPENLTVRYQMLFGGVHIGDVEDKLVFGPDNAYSFSSTAVSVGLAAVLGLGDVTRISTGQFDSEAGLLQVAKFKRTHGDRIYQSTVDRAAGAVEINNKGKLSREPFAPGTEIHDSLTLAYLFYAFAERASDEIDVLFTDGRRVKPYHFVRVAQAESITVPAGTFSTVTYERTEDDSKTIMWYAPELDMVPVHVIFDRPSSKIEFLLVEVVASGESEVMTQAQ